jgi:hypothetical protein
MSLLRQLVERGMVNYIHFNEKLLYHSLGLFGFFGFGDESVRLAQQRFTGC